MTITVQNVLAAAWALWRRDRDVLVRIALPFVLLPALALQLLVPQLVIPADAAMADVVRAQWRYVGDHAGAYLLATAVAEYGHAALLAGYVDPRARDVRAALVRAALIWPRFLLLALMVQLAMAAGLLLLIVPALIVAGRTLPAGAALLAEQPASAAGAVRRAIGLTRGHTLATSALATLLLAGRMVALQPFALMDAWLRALHAPNPVALVVIDGTAAGADMLAAIAGVLVTAVLYRALAGRGDGAGASSGT